MTLCIYKIVEHGKMPLGPEYACVFVLTALSRACSSVNKTCLSFDISCEGKYFGIHTVRITESISH